MDGTASVSTHELAWIAQAKAEPGAFAAIYDHYYPRVYTYVRYRVSEAEAAEDLTAQIFERVLTRIRDYRPERSPFGAWLFAIARNVVNDHLRARRRHPWLPLEALAQHASADPLPEAEVARREALAGLLAALGKLSEREREIIALKFVAGLTNRLIAEMLQLGEKNVSVILYRAVQRLRLLLKTEG